MLIGSADDSPQDVGHLNVTVHHNWFDGRYGNGIGQRMPRGRYGKIHVYNNYMNDAIYSGAMAGYNANMRVDNNYFLNTPDPHPVVGGTTGGDNKMNAEGNIYDNSTGRKDTRGEAFIPSEYYTYTMNEAIEIPVIVMLGAGINADTMLGRVDSTFIDSGETPIQMHYWKNFESIDLFVFPIPSTDKLNVSIKSDIARKAELRIYSISGKNLAYKSIRLNPGSNLLEFNTAKFTKGIYYISIDVDNKHIIKKLIID